MNKNEFIQMAVSHIPEYLPKEYRNASVELTEVAKNNDTLLHGLIIRCGEKKDVEAAPVFYLEPYFEIYQSGIKDAECVMHELARDYLQVIHSMPQFDLPDMTKEGIKDRVYVRVVNTRSNQERLKDLVSLPADGGFSLTVYIDIDTPGKDAMIQITKELAARMEFDERELAETAIRNTVTAHPPVLVEMKKLMMDMAGLRKLEQRDNLLQEKHLPAQDLSMLVLTNSEKFLGRLRFFIRVSRNRLRRLREAATMSFPVPYMN